MKRLLSAVLTVLMLATVFAGCGGSNSGKVELVWASYSRQLEDSKMVLGEFNKQLAEVLPNTSIKMIECDDTNWQLYMSAKKPIDIAWTGYVFDMQNEINSGSYQPLDDLIEEYGPNIKKEMTDYEDDYKSGTYNGKLYMIPCQQAIMNQTSALTIPVSLAKYMDIDAVRAAADKSPTSTKELYDLVDSYLTKVFASSDYDTDVVGTTIDIYSLFQTLAYRGYDFVSSTRNGPLLCYEAFASDPKVVSFYETEAFKLFCEYTAKWCEKGYISEESLLLGTSSGSRDEIMRGNNSAMWYGIDNPETGEERGVVYSFTNGEITSYNVLLSNLNNLFNGVSKLGSENTYLTIPFTSKHPERAMQLLDLLRSEKGSKGNDLLNMLIYGFAKDSKEAEEYGTYHYVLEGDCAYANDYVSQPSSDSKYGISRWVAGNTMLCYRTPNILEGQTEYCIDYEKNTKKTLFNTKYQGATVDLTDHNIDMSNLAAVSTEYAQRIYYGVEKENWKNVYDEMMNKLKASNLEDVKNAAQKQLDDYLSKK